MSNQNTTSSEGPNTTSSQVPNTTSSQGPYTTSSQGPYTTSSQGPYTTSSQGPYTTSSQGQYTTSSQSKNPASLQLINHAYSKNEVELFRTTSGKPLGSRVNSLTAGQRGDILLNDVALLEELAHANRERIPERFAHAKGAGAFGYFKVTHDITKYTKAIVFEKIEKITPVVVRFSTVVGQLGSADTVRDPRGFATKFYTEHGNWDIVGNNIPVFPIRDPILFPSLIHAKKKNPVTNVTDANALWDFQTKQHQTINEFTRIFSDLGIPDGYRFMNGSGINTFKLVNSDNKIMFCKFYWISNQGLKFLTVENATALAGSNPDYATQDLYNAIENGNFPKWTLYIQLMSVDQAKVCKYNPFDVTKEWLPGDYQSFQVGELVLNKNPINNFAEMEQVGFCPAHLIPGIEPSPDKILQGRMFGYSDALRYRLGPNFHTIPVNSAYKVRNTIRDGLMTVTDNQEGAPNYFPNSFKGPNTDSKYEESTYTVYGEAKRYATEDEDNYSQAALYYKSLTNDHKDRLALNIATSVSKCYTFIQQRVIDMLNKCDKDYSERVKTALDKINSQA